MMEKQIKIINKLGLHARAATKFAKTAGRYTCKIQVDNGKSKVDGKSVMSLMLLAASCGTTVTLSCDGRDEQAAMAALEALINNRFDEAE